MGELTSDTIGHSEISGLCTFGNPQLYEWGVATRATSRTVALIVPLVSKLQAAVSSSNTPKQELGPSATSCMSSRHPAYPVASGCNPRSQGPPLLIPYQLVKL